VNDHGLPLGDTPQRPPARLCGRDAPADAGDLDAWVARRLLNPASAMFREGHVLLSEEPTISDLAPYHAVLVAISAGRTRRGEIAQALGRPDSALAHPLTVLEQARLVERVDDAFRQKRATYLVSEPVIRLHELVVRRHEARLTRRQAARVWQEVQDTVRSRIYGPHFETVAREWCLAYAAPATLSGPASRVQPATLHCREHRTDHELDVVVTTVEAHAPDRVTAIGEAKWHGEPVGVEQLQRLEHIRTLLPPRRAPEPPRLLLFSRAGFTPDLSRAARRHSDVEVIDLDRLYRGS
jgi:DNA-binding transcriptional ArsR family regulator